MSDSPLRDRLRRSLQTRVYLLLTVSAIIPVGLLAWAFGLRVARLDQQLVAARLWSARAVAGQVAEQLNQEFEVLQRAATTAQVNLADGDPAAERAALRFPRVRLQFPGGAFFLDAAGEVVAEEPDRGTRSVAPLAGSPEVRLVLETGRPLVTPFVEGRSGEHLYALVPVRDWEGQVTGLVGGAIDAGQHHLTSMLRYLRQGTEGTAEIVDRAGRVVATTDPGRPTVTSACTGVRRLVAEGRDASRTCAECHAGRPQDARGRAVVTTAFVPNAPWAVVARAPSDEVLGVTGPVPPWLAGMILVALGAGALLAWGASRSIAKPVSALTGAAEVIASGDLSAPVPQAGEDEVGRLAQALEKMRQSLARLIDEVGQANALLEQRVVERTGQLAEANAQLREREAALARLYEKVVSAQEDERKRIARELHDDTSQSLAALVMAIDGAEAAIRAGLTPRLEETKALAVRTIEEVHRMILDLRPSVLDDLGLQSAIRWYAERHLSTRGISVRCEFDAEDRRYPAAFETALFRVCQEAMSNVARHAHAEAVLIQLSESEGVIRIEIEDDGRGFEPSKVSHAERRHFGLMGIEERVEILGGKVSIDSAPGQGTRIHLEVPLPREA
ncbi:MAG TPA: ATP-binding protein [Anaeromyxobacteraceae bacterium]|nr:ATP-binding protein [Anaeromyxobacteraceae bacterium]